jgi:Family of unknown function (DUF5931)
MACVVLRGGAALTPAEFGAFLAGQGDLGPRQRPRFVRVASRLPRTPSFKVLTRLLAADRWNTSDPVWWRPTGAPRRASRSSRSKRPHSMPGSAPAGPGTRNHRGVLLAQASTAQGHSAEPLWRALAVYRFACIGYAVVLLVINRADYSRPDLAWVVIAVMTAWRAGAITALIMSGCDFVLRSEDITVVLNGVVLLLPPGAASPAHAAPR